MAKLGEGGMGEVYRAHDPKLNRDVAIKVLPAALASDPDRRARFEREAKVLAALNHPNIAALYGVEDIDGARARSSWSSSMDRRSRDASAFAGLNLDDALPIARQIAEALEAAHERGRRASRSQAGQHQLKGAATGGTVKLLDFGLAKALDADAARTPAGVFDNSPTVTSPAMTEQGMIWAPPRT